MNTRICSTLKDLDRLEGCIVVIDVFRTSNTIIAALAKGAKEVVTVKEIEDALAYAKQNSGCFLLGERNGKKLAGFEGDNSPCIPESRLAAKTVVLTSSGGTRCIEACPEDSEVVIGSFANADALCRYIRNRNIASVTFWAVGVRGEEPAEEDLLCARFLEDTLLGCNKQVSDMERRLLETEGAKRLERLHQFEDLRYCIRQGGASAVPRRKRQATHYAFIAERSNEPIQ